MGIRGKVVHHEGTNEGSDDLKSKVSNGPCPYSFYGPVFPREILIR
jgi:hypothetical protein